MEYGHHSRPRFQGGTIEDQTKPDHEQILINNLQKQFDDSFTRHKLQHRNHNMLSKALPNRHHSNSNLSDSGYHKSSLPKNQSVTRNIGGMGNKGRSPIVMSGISVLSDANSSFKKSQDKEHSSVMSGGSEEKSFHNQKQSRFSMVGPSGMQQMYAQGRGAGQTTSNSSFKPRNSQNGEFLMKKDQQSQMQFKSSKSPKALIDGRSKGKNTIESGGLNIDESNRRYLFQRSPVKILKPKPEGPAIKLSNTIKPRQSVKLKDVIGNKPPRVQEYQNMDRLGRGGQKLSARHQRYPSGSYNQNEQSQLSFKKAQQLFSGRTQPRKDNPKQSTVLKQMFQSQGLKKDDMTYDKETYSRLGKQIQNHFSQSKRSMQPIELDPSSIQLDGFNDSPDKVKQRLASNYLSGDKMVQASDGKKKGIKIRKDELAKLKAEMQAKYDHFYHNSPKHNSKVISLKNQQLTGPQIKAKSTIPRHIHGIKDQKGEGHFQLGSMEVLNGSPHKKFKPLDVQLSFDSDGWGDMERCEVVGLQWGEKTRKGYIPIKPKKPNQDRIIIKPSQACEASKIPDLGTEDYLIMGVFDGHGTNGDKIAEYASNTLTKAFQKQIASHLNSSTPFLNSIQLEQKTISNFTSVQKDVETKCDFDVKFSGTTACVCTIYRSTAIQATHGPSIEINCFNLGDSRGVLYARPKGRTNGWREHTKLSTDHTPALATEAYRVKNSGGRLDKFKGKDGAPFGPLRVYKTDEKGPGLAMTRSLGDLLGHQAGVSSEPEMMQLILSASDMAKWDFMVVVASDGIWEQISNQQFSDLLNLEFGREVEDGGNSIYEFLDLTVKEAHQLWGQNEMIVDDISIAACLIS